MKFLKQATYITYVIAKLSKFVKSSKQTSPRFIFRENSLQIKKSLELVSRPYFSQNLLIKIFLLQFYINWKNFITKLCLLLKLFSNMCFLFMLGHSMNIWKVKVWLYREQKEHSKWWKTFFLVSQVLSVKCKKQTSKNVADTTFKFL